MRISIKNIPRNIVLLISLLVVTIFSFNTNHVVLAQTVSDGQMKLFNDGLFYFNYSDDCASTAGVGAGGSVAGGGIWNSGLQPPFILEQFAIEVLKDISAKRGVDSASAVTEEHVIALVAFMIGEGGDINNRWKFNPLNTGINAPDLIDGAAAGDGTQSFKSFDAGVEGTARTMTGKLQSRLADVLTNKDTTAEDFMDALTHYTKYPNNAFWAKASLPPNTDKYFAGRITLVNLVRNGYANIASIILGTDELEQPSGRRDPSKLVFHPVPRGGAGGGAVTVSTSTAGSCTKPANGTVTGGCTGSKELKVPEGGVGVNMCSAKQCDIRTDGFNWCGCGCEPTSTLMLRRTFEKNPGLQPQDVLAEVQKADGFVGGCDGNLPSKWLKGYLGPKGYTVTKVHDRGEGPISDADLAKVKEMLGQGYIMFSHTKTFIGSDLAKQTDGHYFIIYGADKQGNFYAANPGTVTDDNKAIPPDTMKKWVNEFYAVKRDGQQV